MRGDHPPFVAELANALGRVAADSEPPSIRDALQASLIAGVHKAFIRRCSAGAPLTKDLVTLCEEVVRANVRRARETAEALVSKEREPRPPRLPAPPPRLARRTFTRGSSGPSGAIARSRPP